MPSVRNMSSLPDPRNPKIPYSVQILKTRFRNPSNCIEGIAGHYRHAQLPRMFKRMAPTRTVVPGALRLRAVPIIPRAGNGKAGRVGGARFCRMERRVQAVIKPNCESIASTISTPSATVCRDESKVSSGEMGGS